MPKSVKASVGLKPEDPYRTDLLWSHIKDVNKPGTNEGEFDLLFKLAEAVMTIPHPGGERIFPLSTRIKLNQGVH